MKKIILVILSIFLIENLSAEILTVTNTNDSGTGSLRRIVEIANDGDSIIFDKSLTGKTIELQSGISIRNAVSISGKNASVILSGRNQNEIFSGGKSIDGLTFINATTAISSCSLVFDCLFKDNSNKSNNYGGSAIYAPSSYWPTSIIVINCIFENNTVTSRGGAIYATATSLKITDCIFKNNKSNSGGAIYSHSPLTITNCAFENNIATENGGAIYSTTDPLKVIDCKFGSNKSSSGGAIYSEATTSSLTVTNSTFENNTATSNGGAIYSYSYSATYSTSSSVTNCTFSSNSANNGGAIYGSTAQLKGNIFVNNKIMPDNILNDVKDSKSLGYNVYTSNQNTVFSASSDYRYTGTQSLLVSLGNYGGSTATMPINTSVSDWEIIIRRVPVTTERTTYQRGLPVSITSLACAGSVEMQPNEHFASIPEIQKIQINVYPNPVKNILNIVLTDNSNVQIFNLSGKFLKEYSCKIGNNEINISNLPSGIYFLNLNGKTAKIIKQ